MYLNVLMKLDFVKNVALLILALWICLAVNKPSPFLSEVNTKLMTKLQKKNHLEAESAQTLFVHVL